MADSPVFEAILSVADKASAPIAEIEEKIASFGNTANKVVPAVNEQLAKLGTNLSKVENEVGKAQKTEPATRWEKFNEALKEGRSRFGELGEAAGEFGNRIAEIFPMLGALGAIGSVGGVFELAHKFAENSEAVSLMADKIGISTGALQQLNYAAKETGLDTSSFDDGLQKLDKNLGAAAAGQDKDLASLLTRLHVSLRDTKGNVIDAAGALPALEKAFYKTHDAATRAYIAQVAFGKSGLDLIPFLDQGPGKIEELQKKFDRLGYKYSPEDKENADKFNESWKDMETAVGGFTDELGAKLAPVLTPIIQLFTNWIAANKDWIATDLGGAIKFVEDRFQSWFKSMGGVKGIEKDLKKFGGEVQSTISFVEGLVAAGKELYAGWKQLEGFFDGIGNDVDYMGAKIQSFNKMFGISSGPGHFVVRDGRDVWQPDAPGQTSKAASPPGRQPSAASSSGAAAGPQKNLRHSQIAPIPKPAAAAHAGLKGSIKAEITINGLPPGAKVQTSADGVVASPKVKKGYSTMSGVQE